MESKKHKILFWFIWLILLFPIVQQFSKLVPEKELAGAIVKRDAPRFVFSNWLEGTFQSQMEPYINEEFGFRSYFIRLNNQLSYSLFNYARANGVIIGKDGYLFEQGYINAYFGHDFVGKDSVNSVLNKFKFLQQKLAEKKIDLILVLNPGKVSYYPQYIPDSSITKKSITNYEYYAKQADSLKLNVLNLRNYFISNKNKFPYPLFPKCGIHWSTYCEILAKDTLMKYIGSIKQVKVPEIVIDSIQIAEGKKFRDADIKNGMNLLWGPSYGELAYPSYHIIEKDRIKMNSLFIADSFFWGIYGNPDIASLFKTNSFWFYYVERYHTKLGMLDNATFDLKKEIEKQDVIIVMATESTLPKIGWGFIEAAYELYANEDQCLNKK